MNTAIRERLHSIAGRHNPLVKQLRRACAHGDPGNDGYCAVEGVRLLEEAIRSGLRLHAVFFREPAEAEAARLLPQIGAHVETLLLPDKLFDSAVASESPQGVAALVRLKKFTLEDAVTLHDAPGAAPLLLAVAGIQDPGNLGTLIRSAEAFGASGVLLGEKSVSPLNPKLVRASAGSLFRLPVVRAELLPTLAWLRQRGLRLLAASAHKGTPVDQVQLSAPVAVFIGSEGAGLPRPLLGKMDEVIAIPHSPRVESLNAGVAASIVLYEAARQRRGFSSPRRQGELRPGNHVA